MNEVSAVRQNEAISLETLEERIASATGGLLSYRKDDGHWCFELEADATIPAEYVLMRHYRGEPVDLELERKIGVYLRRIQGKHHGWPLFHNGAFDISASVKAYFALKMIGDDVDAPHMARAREAILAHGGAANANVFTKILLALYQQVPWKAVPTMPVEIMLLPKWFPFHLDKVSYWARTVIVPLLVLQTLKPQAKNELGINVRELFVVPPEQVRKWESGGAHQNPFWKKFFGTLDIALKFAEPHFPKNSQKRAIEKAMAFVDERLNGEDGLGAIFPAMVNALEMYDVLGVPADDPRVVLARQSIEKLLVVKDDEAYCQPCLSPIWDTALASHAMLEVGGGQAEMAAEDALNWLKPHQVLDVKGDWATARPDVRPGGWAFQYANAHYPDVDDTAVVVMGMDRAKPKIGDPARKDFDEAIARAREWVVGLQSENGGWGAFDADNTYHYLNNIPFADHGALLDPPTVDVSARCVSMLAQLGETMESCVPLKKGVDYLIAEQEKDGSWFGRWGVNYIYGTWSVLCALNAAGVPHDAEVMRRAADWLLAIQNSDGGWGEGCDSYKLDYSGYEPAPSAASQTAWAIMALQALGMNEHPAVSHGIEWLNANQKSDGLWPEDTFTGGGFPRVFYLRYHGYAKFFPIWAMARYRNLKKGNSGHVAFGM
ncbi:squalene--hopene cyclase [Terrihabitans sp. B22-R8]|uniref:squalene--hopene cyclase n=1 Tax=Terrihabitans sp. B22-R8 TaxID=3425128 RepID=UPI00403CEB49